MTAAAGQVKARGLRLAGIRVHREAVQSGGVNAPQVTKNLKDTDPETLFREAYLIKNGIEVEERHISAFRDAMAEL